ncbi:MAG TPA: hypothetical protein VF132_04730 [Rudaea sp.]
MRKLRSLTRGFCLCAGFLSLAGCIFGYYAAAPEGYGGEFVLNRTAWLDSCGLGPGLWSGSTAGTCLVLSCEGSDCVELKPGTPVRATHTFVTADGIRDVTLRIGRGADSKQAHAYGSFDGIKEALVRP